MNTIIRIAPPPLGAIVPWTWEYSRVGEQTLPDHWLGIEPQMTQAVWRANDTSTFPDHNATERARDAFGQTAIPRDYRDLIKGRNEFPATPVLQGTTNTPFYRRPRTGYTWAPANQITFVQEDENDRDSSELIRDIPVPYNIQLRLQKTTTLFLTAEFRVNGIAVIPGSPPWYRLYVGFRNLIIPPALQAVINANFTVRQSDNVDIATPFTDAYFDGDDAVLSVITDAHQVPVFDIYGEIISADTGFDVTIAGDGRISATETADVRVRWDSRLTAGLRATLDGKEYTIVETELESRNRFMRLALSRNVA